MNATARWLAIAAVGLCVGTLGAQAPAPQKATGLVMGVVVDSITNKPIPEALITIGSNKVQADTEGRFVFTDMAKGYYSIEAAKSGYHDGAYGRQRPEGPAAMLALGVDERVGNLRIALFKLSAISGQVNDEAGEPLVGAEVDVLLKTWVGGRPALTPAGRTATDDRGLYRVGGLGVGEFVVAAIFKSMPIVRADGTFIYPTHYFSGSTSIEQATSVALDVGEERTSTDITLRPAPSARVSGVLRTATGPLAGPLILTKTEDGLGAGADPGALEVTSEPNGRFTFPAVPAGAYVVKSIVLPPPVRAEISQAPTRLMWASTPLVVDGTEIRDLEVILQPGSRIAGRVVFETAPGRRAPGFDAILRLVGTIESPDVDIRTVGSAATLRVGASGFFSTMELPPGRYFIRIDGLPPGWTLKAVSLDSKDVTNAPVRLNANITDLTFTLTDRPADLGGFVRGDAGIVNGATVLVFPRDRSTWIDFGRRPPGLRAVRSGRDGSFRFVGLPPGEYFIIAVDDDAATNWQQEKQLERLAQPASQVTVAPGENASVDLRTMVIR